jgi:hypothetical protein
MTNFINIAIFYTMCFSATSSFTAAAGLALSGSVGIVAAGRQNKFFIPINLMSIFFAIQQFSEGIIWIGGGDNWGRLYLFFAFFLYPWYLAFSCYLLTSSAERKRLVAMIGAAGVIFGIYLYSHVIFAPDFHASIANHHIDYTFTMIPGFELSENILIPIYFLLSSGPCYFSDQKGTTALGHLLIVSGIFSWIFYTHYFISIWCFYAAIISLALNIFTISKRTLYSINA